MLTTLLFSAVALASANTLPRAHIFEPGVISGLAGAWTAPRIAPFSGEWNDQLDSARTGPAPQSCEPVARRSHGSIYFLSIGKGRTFRLYRSRFANGAYQQAERCRSARPQRPTSIRKSHPTNRFSHEGTSLHRLCAQRFVGERGSSNDNEPDFSPDGRTLYFSSDRTLALRFPRSRSGAMADLQRIAQWDNGNANVWTLPLTPELVRRMAAM